MTSNRDAVGGGGRKREKGKRRWSSFPFSIFSILALLLAAAFHPIPDAAVSPLSIRHRVYENCVHAYVERVHIGHPVLHPPGLDIRYSLLVVRGKKEAQSYAIGRRRRSC